MSFVPAGTDLGVKLLNPGMVDEFKNGTTNITLLSEYELRTEKKDGAKADARLL
jgi:hypothetical protein